jgi:toxin ParE1/3/4
MNPAKLIYTCKAEDDLDSIFDYIAKDSPENALNYIDKIKSAIEHLATSPFIGIHCSSKGIDRDCRILIFENYLIFYQFNEIDNEIKILRILHGSRKYQDLLK